MHAADYELHVNKKLVARFDHRIGYEAVDYIQVGRPPSRTCILYSIFKKRKCVWSVNRFFFSDFLCPNFTKSNFGIIFLVVGLNILGFYAKIIVADFWHLIFSSTYIFVKAEFWNLIFE